MKNIVICCDGTANEFARNKTNVVKLYSMLVPDPARQVAYYHPGLGTMEPAGALTSPARWITKLLGRAFGYGLEADIRDAYIFLMHQFAADDHLFLIGFSRGAYTVRAVASLLHLYGLIRAGNEALVPYAIRMMTALGKLERADDRRPAQHGSTTRGAVDESFQLAAQFRATFSVSYPCKPWFIGVWDTVSAVGWIENPLVIPYSANNPDIHVGRHAIAIDERRAFFRQNLWGAPRQSSSGEPQDLQQVWFPGVHCDIGGGYPESESGLSNMTLDWMLREAEVAGLLLDRDPQHNNGTRVLGSGGGEHIRPAPTARIHESLQRWWRLAEFVPRRRYHWTTGQRTWSMNLFRRRRIPEHALIHESAFARGEQYASRLPVTAIRAN